jgi:hypothetical protein
MLRRIMRKFLPLLFFMASSTAALGVGGSAATSWPPKGGDAWIECNGGQEIFYANVFTDTMDATNQSSWWGLFSSTNEILDSVNVFDLSSCKNPNRRVYQGDSAKIFRTSNPQFKAKYGEGNSRRALVRAFQCFCESSTPSLKGCFLTWPGYEIYRCTDSGKIKYQSWDPSRRKPGTG